jgi:hypothetical protein
LRDLTKLSTEISSLLSLSANSGVLVHPIKIKAPFQPGGGGENADIFRLFTEKELLVPRNLRFDTLYHYT